MNAPQDHPITRLELAAHLVELAKLTLADAPHDVRRAAAKEALRILNVEHRQFTEMQP